MSKAKFLKLKKCICVLVGLLTVFTVGACDWQTKDTEIKSVDGPPVAGGFLMENSEYSLSLFKQWVDIDTFISAEMLADRFGEFYLFGFERKMETYPYSGQVAISEYMEAYTYIFDTDAGGKYNSSVRVEKLEPDGIPRHLTPKEGQATDVESNDLRTAGTPGAYLLGDIEYVYVYNGEYDSERSILTYIQWSTNGYVFRIDINETVVKSYDLEENGFIEQLLREETAEEAVAEFNRDISRSLVWGRIYRNWLPWLVPGVLVISVAATYLLLRRKKRKREIAKEFPTSEALPETAEPPKD